MSFLTELAPQISLAGIIPDTERKPVQVAVPLPKKYDHKSSDEDLRAGCLSKVRSAQEALYKKYFGQLLGIPMRYTGDRNDAVDILNQAFLKIFDCLHQYQNSGSFPGWMARVVFNTTIDHVRRKTAYQKKVSFGVEAEKPIDNEAVSNLNSEYLFALIQKLPASSRAVFCLYVIDGHKHAEIAEILNIDEGTSKWHLSEARRRLKSMLEKS